jgi:putative (di)nucleoside polyphosphate hydrolase
MEEKKFRRAIGAIVLNKKGKIIAFNRIDFTENWQGIEGGMEENETPLEALYRESFEEVGLSRDKFEIIKETSGFVSYLFPDGKKWRGYDGQEKKFYLLKIIDDFDDFKYDNNPDGAEFRGHIIMDAGQLLDKAPRFKRDMYEKVLREFEIKFN